MKKKAVKKTTTVELTIGETYVFETVTRFFTGRLVAQSKEMYVLSDAAWIAHTGYYEEFLKTGKLRSVEPIPDGQLTRINRGSIVAIQEWHNALPRVRI